MFSPLLLVAALSTAAQAASPSVGQRTMSPDQLLASFGATPNSAEEDPTIAAAAAFPLGSTENPVRVGGPEGERAYLARLRCGNGAAPGIGARADGGVGAFGSVVNSYTLDCGSAAPGRASIALDIYHGEHREDRAPPGFTISPTR